MPLPAAAATALKAAQAVDQVKDAIGGGGGQKKKGNTLKIIIALLIACIVAPMLLIMVVVMLLVGSASTTVESQASAQSSTVPAMPDVCSSLTAGAGVPAAFPQVIDGVATALGIEGGTVTSANCTDFTKNGQAMLLLAMAWTDSQWGTLTSTTLSTTAGSAGAGALAAAQAAYAAGCGSDGNLQNLETAVAVAGVESTWSPDPDNDPPTTDGANGEWQIEWSNIAGLDSQYGLGVTSPSQLLDVTTNAKAMYYMSSDCSNFTPDWISCEDAQGIDHESGSCDPVPPVANGDHSYQLPQNWDPAVSAAEQVEGVGLSSADYEGLILMAPAVWTAAGITDPTNPADAASIMKVVLDTMNTDAAGATWPASDPTPQLEAFYATDQTTPDNSIIDAHVQVIVNTYQTSSGGVGTVVTLAETAATQVWHITNFCNQGANGAAWSNCDEEWCADFATWVWWKSGVNIPDIPGVDALYTWGTNHNLVTTTPAPGDLALWGDGAHVSIVVSVSSGGNLVTVNGDDWTGAEPVTSTGAFNPLGSFVVQSAANTDGAGEPGPLMAFLAYPGTTT